MSINNSQNSNNSQNATSNIVQNIVGGVVNNLTSDTAKGMSNAANLYAITNGYKNGDYVNSSLGFGAMGMNLLNNPVTNTLGLGIPLAGDIINKDWKALGLDSARILADKILLSKLSNTSTSSIPATLSNTPNTALNSAANATGVTGSSLGAVGASSAGLSGAIGGTGAVSTAIPAVSPLGIIPLGSNTAVLQTSATMNALGATAGTTFLQGLAGATIPTAIPAFFAGLGLSIANMVKKKQWEKDLKRYNQRRADFEKYNQKYSKTPDLNNLNNDLLNHFLGRTLIDRSAADSLINGVDNSRNMLTELQTDPQIQQTLANINDTIQQARLNIQDNNIKELVLDPYSYSNKTPQELNLYKAAIQKNIIELDSSLEPYSTLAGNGVGKEMYKQAIKEIDSIIADKAYKGGVNYGKYTPENSGPNIYKKAQLTKLSQEKGLLAKNTDFWQKRVDTLKQELGSNANSNPLMGLISQFKNKEKIENLKVAEATLSSYKLRAKDVDDQMFLLKGNVETTTNNSEIVSETPIEPNTGSQTNNQDQQNTTVDPINNNQGGTIDDTVNNQYEENDDSYNTNNALQGNVVENILNPNINSDPNPIFPWNINDKELDNAVFDSVIKTVTDNWNEKQSKRVDNNSFDKTEYMANTRKWAPEKGSTWHEDNFKDASTVEQVIYADSIHLMNIPEKNLTPEDRNHFEENIKLLSVLKSLRDGTMKQHVSEELERMKLIEEIRKVAASKGLNMPDLSHMNNQQKPYSRIPRELNVSRGDYRTQNKINTKELTLKLNNEWLIDHHAKRVTENHKNLFIAKDKKAINEILKNYNYIETLRLVSHAKINQITAMGIAPEKDKLIGYYNYYTYQGALSEIQDSMPKELDLMLKEKRIRNLVLIGCNTGGTIKGSQSTNKNTDFDKLEKVANNKYNFTRLLSQIYPGVYFYGIPRRINFFTSKYEYIIYYNDGVNRKPDIKYETHKY